MSLPKRFPDRNETAAVRKEIAVIRTEAEGFEPGAFAEDQEANWRRLAGRVVGRRDLGGAVFLDLVGRSRLDRIQLAFLIKEVVAALDVHLGDIIGVSGLPGRTRKGEPTVFVFKKPELLARPKRPLPDTFHGLLDTETRYRKRYLDLLVNAESREVFLTRSRIVQAIRHYLDGEGFLEVETPVLQPRYGGAFAEPFVTHHRELDTTLFLRIADELYLKRLIVGGLEKVYEIGKDFRNEGFSSKHQPEFTMLEWYEAYADYRDTMGRIEQLLASVTAKVLGSTTVSYRGSVFDFLEDWERIPFVQTLEARGVWTRDIVDLRDRLQAQGVDTSHDSTWAQLIDHAFTHFVEPDLIKPTIIYDYPIELSPFARTTDEDPSLAERFEYFAGGVELGNAFTEINDPVEQQRRFDAQLKEGILGDQTAEPGDPDYVEALSYGMPPTGGLGLGIDRLVMVLTGRETIRDVILFPLLRERD